MAVEVDRIRLRELRLPLREPFRISSGTEAMRRILLLEVTDATGVTAWAECVAGQRPNYSPETVDTAWLAIREWVAPRVLGRRFDEPGQVYPLLERDFRGHQMAKAAVEMAVWTLEADLRGISLSELLGGTRDKIPVGISIGVQTDPSLLAAKVEEACEVGYRRIKIKIQPGSDLVYVAAVRARLGPEVPLMVDGNAAYTLDDADHLAELDGFDLLMIEQPLAWDDLSRHAELQRRLTTAICLDESITSLARVEDMLALESGRVVNIKPGRVGGFASALAIHDLCAVRGIPVWCGGMLESGVGRAYNVALASLPNFVFPGDISPSVRYWERDVVIPEWSMNGDGTIAVPKERPGIGVEVDVDRVEELTVRQEWVRAE